MVLGVSYDDSQTQARFAIHCAANFPLLSDRDGVVAGRYDDASGFGPFRFAGRKTFLIDGHGIVRHVYDGMPDDARILADVKKLSRS